MRKKKESSKEEKVDDSWLLPYADMLTLLLALFIILFAVSELDAQKYKELSYIFKGEFSSHETILDLDGNSMDVPGEMMEKAAEEEKVSDEDRKSIDELNDLTALQERLDSYIIEEDLTEALGTLLTDEGLLITIINDVSFDSGSAKIIKKGREIAKEVSDFLYIDPPHQIVVSGHADDRPIGNNEFSSNWELSVMRAVNFMGLLLENEHLNPVRFSAKGFGEHHPIVPNTSEANRAKNRRVEVLILPNYKIKTSE